jgi:Ankyrin repeat
MRVRFGHVWVDAPAPLASPSACPRETRERFVALLGAANVEGLGEAVWPDAIFAVPVCDGHLPLLALCSKPETGETLAVLRWLLARLEHAAPSSAAARGAREQFGVSALHCAALSGNAQACGILLYDARRRGDYARLLNAQLVCHEGPDPRDEPNPRDEWAGEADWPDRGEAWSDPEEERKVPAPLPNLDGARVSAGAPPEAARRAAAPAPGAASGPRQAKGVGEPCEADKGGFAAPAARRAAAGAEMGVPERKDDETQDAGCPGPTALSLACAGGHLAAVKVLLEAGADATLGEGTSWSPADQLVTQAPCAQRDEDWAARLEILATLPCADWGRVSWGVMCNLCVRPPSSQDASVWRLVLGRNAKNQLFDLHLSRMRDEDGGLGLVYEAARHHQRAALEFLLDHGAERHLFCAVRRPDASGGAPHSTGSYPYQAAFEGDGDDPDDDAPPDGAAEEEATRELLLVRMGCEARCMLPGVERAVLGGETVLHRAIRRRCGARVVQLLVWGGANWFQPNASGETPFGLALGLHPELVAELFALQCRVIRSLERQLDEARQRAAARDLPAIFRPAAGDPLAGLVEPPASAMIASSMLMDRGARPELKGASGLEGKGAPRKQGRAGEGSHVLDGPELNAGGPGPTSEEEPRNGGGADAAAGSAEEARDGGGADAAAGSAEEARDGGGADAGGGSSLFNRSFF